MLLDYTICMEYIVYCMQNATSQIYHMLLTWIVADQYLRAIKFCDKLLLD